MIKRLRIATKNLPKIDYGSEAHIYLYHGKVLKNFREGYFWNLEQDFYENKLQKLEILQELNLPTHPDLYDFYMAKFDGEKKFYAYTMQYFIDDMIPVLACKTFEDQLLILKKIWENVQAETAQDIYNVDIKSDNYFMSKEGKLITLDIDNLQVGQYPYDISPAVLNDLIKFCKQKPRLIELQNLSMLMSIIDTLSQEQAIYYNCQSLRKVIDKLIVDEGLKKVMNNITMGQEENVGEVIRALKPSSVRRK